MCVHFLLGRKGIKRLFTLTHNSRTRNIRYIFSLSVTFSFSRKSLSLPFYAASLKILKFKFSLCVRNYLSWSRAKWAAHFDVITDQENFILNGFERKNYFLFLSRHQHYPNVMKWTWNSGWEVGVIKFKMAQKFWSNVGANEKSSSRLECEQKVWNICETFSIKEK